MKNRKLFPEDSTINLLPFNGEVYYYGRILNFQIALLKNGAIASLRIGAERKFSFKHKKEKNRISLFLEHGSLLIMKGCTQSHWLQQLPANKEVKTLRINLTFRTIIGETDKNHLIR